jgi:alpha-ketoglutarate-dependent taurine dioxygenase
VSLQISPTDATLGATVYGVALGALSDCEWHEIEAAFNTYAVLIFPAQHLNADQQIAFARRFGDIEEIVADRKTISISNQRSNGTLLTDDEPIMQLILGNEGWHTDSSYMHVAAKATVLSAHTVPTSGGATEWADMRAAFDALEQATRARVESLAARHSVRYSQARLGYAEPAGFSYGFEYSDPPLRPLVKVHPVTGRKSLFLGRHAHGIPNLSASESEQLLDNLMDFACRAPRTFAHNWQPGDIVIWDNRCVLHRAHPWNHAQARVMHHTRISGDPTTESAQSA